MDFFIVKQAKLLYKYCKYSIKTLNCTQPLNEPSGLPYCCDVTTILYICRKCRNIAVKVIPRLQ